MTVSVEFHQDTYDYFFAVTFSSFPGLKESLVADFQKYKNTGMLPHYFGRDTCYSRPPEIIDSGLMHIHLELGNNAFQPKPGKTLDTLTQWERTSDSALLYSQNLYDESRFSLIAIFHPVAHLSARDEERMRLLASFAKEYRNTLF